MADELTEVIQSSECEQTAADKPTDFLSLPSELRNKIYDLSLLKEERLNPWRYYQEQKPTISPSLLRVNKTIHGEASAVFYGQNRFDFSSFTPEELGTFFKQIGGNNAGYIRDIIIRFPDIICPDNGYLRLEENGVRILASIHGACTNLSTITTSLYSTDLMEQKLDSLDDFKVALLALALVDDGFRSIPSVQQIILEVYEDGPSYHIRGMMESRGWKMSMKQRPEEEEYWDRCYSDFGDDNYDYDNDSSQAGDDYDIENDNDFWAVD